MPGQNPGVKPGKHHGAMVETNDDGGHEMIQEQMQSRTTFNLSKMLWLKQQVEECRDWQVRMRCERRSTNNKRNEMDNDVPDVESIICDIKSQERIVKFRREWSINFILAVIRSDRSKPIGCNVWHLFGAKLMNDTISTPMKKVGYNYIWNILQ